jgi:hypothetical protein
VLIHQSPFYLLHVVTIHEPLTLDQLELFVMVVRITKERGGGCRSGGAIFASTTLGFTLGARKLSLDRRQAASKSASITSSLFRASLQHAANLFSPIERAKRWHSPGKTLTELAKAQKENVPATLSSRIFVLKRLARNTQCESAGQK